MPLTESVCTNPGCSLLGRAVEHYYHNSSLPMNDCEACGGPTTQVMSNFQIVWTGPISKRYRDKGADGYHDPDGQVAYTRKTSDGKPKAVHLNTWQDVARFAKAEGCADPRSIGRNMEPGEGGKGLANSRGLPGTEL